MISRNKIFHFLLQSLIFVGFLGFFYLEYKYNNNLFLIIQITFLVILLLLEFVQNTKLYSPIIFWYIFWLGAIIITRFEFQSYNFNLLWENILFKYIFWNTFVFFFIYKFFSLILNPRKQNKNIEIKYNANKLYTFTILFLILGNITFVFNSISLGLIPMLTNNANEYRGVFVKTIFFKVVNITRGVIIFIPIILHSKISRYKKQLLFINFILFSIFNILTGWRSYFFQIMILYFSSEALYIYNIFNNKNKIIKYFFLSIASVSVIGIIREGKNIFDYSFIDIYKYITEIIYLYIAPNFINLQNALKELTPNYNFLYTSQFIWGILFSPDSFSSFEHLSYSIGAFNVSTYLLHPYADFGLFGTLFWSFLIAFFSSLFYYLFQKKNKLYYLMGLGIVNMTIFMMHNNFFLRSSSVVIWFIMSIVFYMLSRKKVI